MEGGRFKIKPEIYLDLSLDGKPSERVVLQENSTASHANIALIALHGCEDEMMHQPTDLHAVDFYYSSSRFFPTQEVSHHDPGRLNYAKAYLRRGGARLNAYSVVFTHMQFLNRSYPVLGYSKQGMETLRKIYRSTKAIKIEITGCGEIPQEDLEPIMCYPVGPTGGIGPQPRMCFPVLRYLGMEGMGPPLVRTPTNYGNQGHPPMYTADQGYPTADQGHPYMYTADQGHPPMYTGDQGSSTSAPW